MTAAAPAALTHEQGVLARAVSRAPPAHNSRPWQLRVRGTEVDLLQRRAAHTTVTGDGVPEEALSSEALPVAGLVRPDTPVPDDVVLAGRLAAENLLAVCTDGDTRAEHLAAGAALQRARLVSEVVLPGVPQAIFRFGYPAVPAAPSPRLPLGELFPDEPSGGLR